MANRRIIDLYMDVETGILVDADGARLTSNLILQRGTNVLFKVRCVDAANAVFAIDSSVSFFFGIDKDFTADQADEVTSNHSEFNIDADWPASGDGISLSNGRFSCRASLSTTLLKTNLGSLNQAVHWASFWMQDTTGFWTLLCQFPVDMWNVAADPTSPAAADVPNYITAGTFANVIEQFTEGGIAKVRIKSSDGQVQQVWPGA